MQQQNFSIRQLALLTIILSCTFGLLGCQQPTATQNAANAGPATALPSPSVTATAVSPTPEAAAVPALTPVETVAPASGPTPVASPPVANPTKVTDLTQGKDFELAMLDSPKVKLSKLLGRRKVLVINFWATWCGPCRREIPDLVALQKSYQGNKDVEIIGLTIEDPAQFTDMVKAFSKQFEINYKIGFSPVPMFMAFNGTDPRGPIPQTFIIGKDGQLLQHIKGMRPAFKDYIQQTVDLALKS